MILGSFFSGKAVWKAAISIGMHSPCSNQDLAQAVVIPDTICSEGPRMVNLLGRRSNGLFQQVGVRMAEDFRAISID
jgi:hypothetical protein